ncbi:PAAR-like domain-containing protein [Massilia soli]|uniref:DUF4150 domain-containing protein n=1 Tax=Massilia soli TaxID=2792854 RepID=A0ABS7SVV1_9BURK|nr:PAAR-like domain-containing protein [Massilia soli]MBZ2210091.1 DUF4150 domain-containing protein [Massilia soli]
MSSSRDKLRLSDPMGSAPKGDVVLDRRSIEDQLAERAQWIENEKRIAQLERSNAKLEAQLSQIEPAVPNANATGQGKVSHIAHSEGWQAICTAPDFCKVGNAVVAFNSFATLDMQQTASPNVKARGTAVYRKGDMIKQVQGDAGKHIVSGTSLGSGHVKILDGHDNVKVNGIPVARHDSRCLINCDASGVGGAQGKLVTERKSVTEGKFPSHGTAPSGERSSEKLDALNKVRAQLVDGMLNLNASDKYINFDQSNEVLSDLIGQIRGNRGTALGYAAQVARGVLGFGKDIVLGTGEILYEGIKAVPKVVQLSQTESGRLLAQLDAQILAEDIKLGNITPGTVGQGALQLGKAIIKPVTDPWAKGDYVEAVARGAAEIGTLALGWLKGNKAARVAKGANASKTAGTAGVAAVANSVDAAAAQTARTSGGHVNSGVHVKVGSKPEFSGDWNKYQTHGIKADPMKSAEGRRLVRQFEEQGMSERTAIKEARELIKTGSSPPMANPIEVGDKLFKVIPEGRSVSQSSAFWATDAELRTLKGLTYDQIADKLGVPLASQQGTKFHVMEITAFRNGTSFTSVIAPTTEVGANGVIWSQRGGGLQTLLTDRSIFTQPKLTAIKFP